MLRRALALVLAGARRCSAWRRDARAQGDDDVVQRPERLTAGVADQLLGQLAPDGKTLYFVSNRNTANELYRAGAGDRPAPSSSSTKAPTSPGRASAPTASASCTSRFATTRRASCACAICRTSERRCLDDAAARCRRSGSTTRASRSSAATRSRATCASSTSTSAARSAARTLVERNLTSPTVSPDGRWIVYVPVERYVERVGPGVRGARRRRLEAMRLDRPSDPPLPLRARSAGADRAAGLQRRRQACSTSRSSSTTPTTTAPSTPAITACCSACRSSRRATTRRRARPRRGPSSSPSRRGTANIRRRRRRCSSPPARGRRQRARRLQPAARRAGAGRWSAERLALEVQLSARTREQTLLYRHLLVEHDDGDASGGS